MYKYQELCPKRAPQKTTDALTSKSSHLRFQRRSTARSDLEIYSTVDPKQVGQQRSIPKSTFRDINKKGDKRKQKGDKTDTKSNKKEQKEDRIETRRTQ